MRGCSAVRFVACGDTRRRHRRGGHGGRGGRRRTRRVRRCPRTSEGSRLRSCRQVLAPRVKVLRGVVPVVPSQDPRVLKVGVVVGAALSWRAWSFLRGLEGSCWPSSRAAGEGQRADGVRRGVDGRRGLACGGPSSRLGRVDLLMSSRFSSASPFWGNVVTRRLSLQLTLDPLASSPLNPLSCLPETGTSLRFLR